MGPIGPNCPKHRIVNRLCEGACAGIGTGLGKGLGAGLGMGLWLCAMTLAAEAAVPEDVAARLGEDLTPMGSEKAGNADGTIPAWTGGLTGIPDTVSFDPESELHPNPFPEDRPLFTITPANMAEHADKLTEGYTALLKTYPDYSMPVYPSRRSCAYPKAVYEANRRNAALTALTPNGSGVTGGTFGLPFAIPGQGLEMVWNQTLRYRGFKLTRQFAAAPVTRRGDYTLQIVQDEAIIQWSDPGISHTDELDNISLYYISNTVAPARSAGNILLVHETIDQSKQDRAAWQYSPGTRRVRRAPNIAYDNPGFNSDALSTADAFDGFNGAPDRYDWRLIGKQEKYIAYNTYDAALVPIADLLQAGHLNQSHVRYELHRVWVIEATLREGTRHVYGRRVFYIDEDATQLAAAELYDSRGELWRVQEIHTLNYYHVPLCGSGAEVVYDLQNGRYLALSMRNEQPPLDYSADHLDADRYQPARLRRLGVR